MEFLCIAKKSEFFILYLFKNKQLNENSIYFLYTVGRMETFANNQLCDR